MRRLLLLLLLVPLLSVLPHPAPAQRVNATYLGNCAFRIGLGEWTVLTDFPWRPGCAGCDAYQAPADLGSLRGTVLVTDDRPEHFDRDLYGRTRLELIAPFTPKAAVDAATATLEGQGIYVYPQPGADSTRWAYIVTYRGRRMFMAGEADDPSSLLAASGLAVAFVTPRMLEAVRAAGKRIDARLLVVMRQGPLAEGDPGPPAPCDGCRMVIPRSGEVVELFR